MNTYKPLSIIGQKVPAACPFCQKKDFKIIDIDFENEDICVFAECQSCGSGCFFVYGKKK